MTDNMRTSERQRTPRPSVPAPSKSTAVTRHRGALDGLLGYQLRRASNAMMSTLADKLAPVGLTIVEASVLLALAEEPGSTQSAVGARLDIQRSNMAPMTAKLVRSRLVKGERSAGRATALRLTALGERVASTVWRVFAEHEKRHVRRLPPRDRARLIAWLQGVWSPGTS
jgi:DNA-binding MarR family transcriptional regulator